MRKRLLALKRLKMPYAVPPWLRWLLHRIGRRGAFLAFLVILDGIFAYALAAPLAGPPNWIWTAVWGAGAVNAASGILARRGRDRVQYALAAGIKTAWALNELRLWMSGDLRLGWLSAVIWIAFAAIVLLISSWPEPGAELNLTLAELEPERKPDGDSL